MFSVPSHRISLVSALALEPFSPALRLPCAAPPIQTGATHHPTAAQSTSQEPGGKTRVSVSAGLQLKSSQLITKGASLSGVRS